MKESEFPTEPVPENEPELEPWPEPDPAPDPEIGPAIEPEPTIVDDEEGAEMDVGFEIEFEAKVGDEFEVKFGVVDLDMLFKLTAFERGGSKSFTGGGSKWLEMTVWSIGL